MALLGPYYVTILPGSRVRGPKRQVTRTPAPDGVNGVEIQRGAYDVPVSVILSAATCANEAAALDIIAGYEALLGEDILYVSEGAINFPGMTVLDVICEDPDPRLIITDPDTPGDTWEVRARWLLQAPYSPIRPGAL